MTENNKVFELKNVNNEKTAAIFWVSSHALSIFFGFLLGSLLIFRIKTVSQLVSAVTLLLFVVITLMFTIVKYDKYNRLLRFTGK